MVAEVFAGISAFKSMFDLAKGLKDISDATIRNGAIIELQGQILAAQAAQTELIQRVGELEEKIASFEKWDAEKEKYELVDIGSGSLAYMLNAESRGSQPPHWLCTQCYENRKKSIVQHAARFSQGELYICPGCNSKLMTRSSPRWP